MASDAGAGRYQLAHITHPGFVPKIGRGKYVWVRAQRPTTEPVHETDELLSVYETNLCKRYWGSREHSTPLLIAHDAVELLPLWCERPPYRAPPANMSKMSMPVA